MLLAAFVPRSNNDEQTMHFIDCYEKEEVLWNTKLQSYRNRDARGEAVNRIVLGMNIEGFGPDHVISKFKNLRSSYKKSGTSSEDVYVPHVVWFTKMNSFLKPYVTMRDTCSNYVISNENKSNDMEKTDQENQSIEASINELESNLTEPDISTNVNYTNTTGIKKKLFKSSQKEILSSSETDTVLAAVKQLDGIAERAQKLAENSKREDSFDQFGKYIASILRDQLPLKKSYLLQQKMTNMIMNEIIENDNQNAIHELQRSSSLQTSTDTSDFGSPAMFDELLSETEDYMLTDLSNTQL
ncbi:hypothetical protein QTP88_021695 [Uroleucon formosanum]